MRIKQLLLSLTTLILVLAPLTGFASGTTDGTTSAAEVKAEIDDAIKAIVSYSAEQRDAALARAEQSLQKTDSSIAELQARLDKKWDQMSQEARQKTREALNDLQRQRTRLAEWYGGLQHSSANAWEELKKGFANSYRELERSLDRARKEY